MLGWNHTIGLHVQLCHSQLCDPGKNHWTTLTFSSPIFKMRIIMLKWGKEYKNAETYKMHKYKTWKSLQIMLLWTTLDKQPSLPRRAGTFLSFNMHWQFPSFYRNVLFPCNIPSTGFYHVFKISVTLIKYDLLLFLFL